ncbi:DJ-1/PfpI family protein [Arthrobacter burdickii]|uniref:DJ-1/PfpI family protein n=1 Tax=Arthrobacter burdickii TaxID=3035920 RepID=A0ABT8K389_9MICC|nr:DJ-1/PfpI family protein [Arthrobacter burdickii]MDN4611885.1 DJ-1/PfpI family protein [Arthrobacter burdickii]
MRALLRRLASITVAVALVAGTLVGTVLAGSEIVQRDNAAAIPVASSLALPVPAASSEGPVRVAVLLGRTGTEAADVLAPYDVLASSDSFSVYTVSQDRAPVQLVGAPPVLPTHTFADIDSGAVAPPDLVVVPAVEEPAGEEEAGTRAWIVRQADHGARILGVCSGSMLLAAAGLLDGHTATSHWSRLGSLRESNPDVQWVGGQRYVQDGQFTTTAGVSSGVPGALRMIHDFAGPEEAARVGALVGYPGWSVTRSTAIPEQAFAAADAQVGLNAVLPWFRPTVGVGLTDGIGEMDAVATFEAYMVSGAARTVAVAATASVTTRHGMVLLTTPVSTHGPAVDRLVLPGSAAPDPRLGAWASERSIRTEVIAPSEGRTAFDSALEELSAHAGRATVAATAKFIEYPIEQLDLDTEARGFRSTLLLGVAVLLALGAGALPSLLTHLTRRSRARSGLRTSP